ncbi:Cysteine and histidine-rich domain-containing protein 1 [Clonorchis sinensis]|uniref:Cysteine and histidine-rich domain-containing protein 1 n=1 Tax=Clonorchis sinensis TaxID=79923 RepID=A0A8T1N154_CLOSI|nr:Cysteine and histidine-rich domain-containing protein 1 [Clonorchis sinensis]
MTGLLQCYNKGCGQKYDEGSNTEDSCQYHPGEPIFHDAKKKWSCCKKFSTDFSEFLSIKGCTKGKHSNVRPVEPEKNKTNGTDSAELSSVPFAPAAPAPIPPVSNSQPRPSPSEPMCQLSVEVTPSLKTLLSKMSIEHKSDAHGTGAIEEDTGNVAVGTSCKNSGCKATYSGTAADNDLCLYHPGVPIFHEGMKYWTCCNRKTSEFESFMEQIGCATGRHNWTEKAARATNLAVSIAAQATCRHDWFQLPGQVIITVYAKAVIPESVNVTANRVRLHAIFEFGSDRQRFDKTFELCGTVDPEASVIKLMGTKVEIVLKKGEAMSWPRLEILAPSTATGDESKTQ